MLLLTSLWVFQHMLAKLMIEVLCLGKDSTDATRLLNYKAPKTARAVCSAFLFFVWFTDPATHSTDKMEKNNKIHHSKKYFYYC